MMLVPLMVIVLIAVLLVLFHQIYLMDRINQMQDNMKHHNRKLKDYYITTSRICEEYGANPVKNKIV